jgi:hypothetical protein
MTVPTAARAVSPGPTTTVAGNRLVLAGAVVYFLEWVAIIGAGGIDVLFAPGTAPAHVLQGYAGQSDAFGWAAGWFSVVLLGRVLFAVALRDGLRRAGGDDPVADFGVLAMTVGVVVEMSAYAVVMAAAVLADHGASAAVVTAVDTAASALDGLVWGTTGAAALALSLAMVRSGRFPRLLCGIGILGGTLPVVQGLAFNAPRFADVQGALQAGVLGLWVWMVWTGILMWRRPRVPAHQTAG